MLVTLGVVVLAAAGVAEPPAFSESAAPPQAWSATVTEHGAKGDGEADDTASFQAALDAAADKGGIVYVPAGTYLIGGSLSVPAGVVLRGVWEAPHHADAGRGSILLATSGRGDADGEPFIMLHQSSAVRGITIFYPDQKPDDIQPYPWCIRGTGMHCSVIDVTLVNPYKGVDFGTLPNELHHIRNLFGQPLHTGIYINGTTDIGRIENVHFNPHAWGRAEFAPGPFSELDLEPWLRKNFTGFLIGKTDWEYMSNCFVIFPKTGFHFIRTEKGDPNAVLTQCGADVCLESVRVDASQSHAGVAFVNSQIMSTVVVSPENEGPVKFTNCGFWPIPETREQVIVNGSGTVTLNACHFSGWGLADAAAPCVRVDGGTTLIQGCDFFDATKTQILLGPDAQGVSVVGCRMRGGERIVNASAGAQVQSGLNLAN